MLGVSIAEFVNEPSLVNGAAVVLDAVSTAVPILPAGGGLAIRALTKVDDVVDGVKALNQADNLSDAVKASDNITTKGVDTGLGPHAPGGVPNDWVVVKGGTKPPPPPGDIFSTSFGRTLDEAGAGVPHGQIRPTTAGQIRANGGSIEVAPEMTGEVMNYQHANVVESKAPTVFQQPIPNPVPKSNRIGGADYGK
jgi:hypothetical protein